MREREQNVERREREQAERGTIEPAREKCLEAEREGGTHVRRREGVVCMCEGSL